MAKKEMKDVKWTPELIEQTVKELGCKSRSELQRMDGKTYKATLRMNKLFLEV